MHDFEDAPFSSTEQANLRAIRDSLHRNEATLLSVQEWLSMLLTDPPEEEVRTDSGEPMTEKEVESLVDWLGEVQMNQDLGATLRAKRLAELQTHRTEETGPSGPSEARAQQIRQLRDLALEARALSSVLLKTAAALAADHMGGETQVWRRVLVRLYEEELGPGDDQA